jgi:hypothetical protein
MVNPLTPVRRIEAKRVITHLFAHEQFDAERFVEILAGIMVETPEVVKVAARHLEAWNEDRRCIVWQELPARYEEVAEVVLDTAAIYRGGASAEVVPSREATRADVEVWTRVSETLRGSRDCFLRAASGSVSRGAFEAQAAACNRALAELLALLGNGPDESGDKEV